MSNSTRLVGSILDVVTGETRRRTERDKVAIMRAELARQEGKRYTLADYGNGLECRVGEWR